MTLLGDRRRAWVGDPAKQLLNSRNYRRCVARDVATRRAPSEGLKPGHHGDPSDDAKSTHDCRSDECEAFTERECLRGGLGQFEAKYLMPLALANAGRLGKYGA